MEAKGKGFLKVVGILMIIGGAIGIISSIVLLACTAPAAAVLSMIGISSGAVIASGLLGLVGAALELVAGILGVKNCADPSKANSCIAFGIVVLALTVISNILYFSVLSFLLGLILPVLYLIGAFLNKQSAAQ